MPMKLQEKKLYSVEDLAKILFITLFWFLLLKIKVVKIILSERRRGRCL
jgi:hypothetical protein